MQHLVTTYMPPFQIFILQVNLGKMVSFTCNRTERLWHKFSMGQMPFL